MEKNQTVQLVCVVLQDVPVLQERIVKKISTLVDLDPNDKKKGNDHEHFAFGGHLSDRERKYNSNQPSPYDGSDTDSESSQIKGMGSFLKRKVVLLVQKDQSE